MGLRLRIHLGHHFYGAGNLGDDFMLAGFLAALRTLAPETTLTCCVPFPREPLAARFPEINWLPYEPEARRNAIAASDVWLGLGGSPFQHALSRWFIDHLAAELELCTGAAKPMFFLGIGVQSRTELEAPEVRAICARAAGIWTRDPGSAELLADLSPARDVQAAADLAHVFFHRAPPPPAVKDRITVVANFDYGAWPGMHDCLDAAEATAGERVWLAQESRELPGAERALYASLAPPRQARWILSSPDVPGSPLGTAFGRWPSSEWLVSARYHAALAGSWSASKVIVITTNEKLRAAAREIGCPSVATDADIYAVRAALSEARIPPKPVAAADAALVACRELVTRAQASARLP